MCVSVFAYVCDSFFVVCFRWSEEHLHYLVKAGKMTTSRHTHICTHAHTQTHTHTGTERAGEREMESEREIVSGECVLNPKQKERETG